MYSRFDSVFFLIHFNDAVYSKFCVRLVSFFYYSYVSIIFEYFDFFSILQKNTESFEFKKDLAFISFFV